MIFNKNIKLFVITVLMTVYVQAFSVSQIGDIRIEQSDGKWVCDMIECPPNTDRCFIMKSNEEQASVLKRINICYSKDNTILAEKTSSTSINPRFHIRQYINSYHSGTISTTNNAADSNFDEKQFNEEMKHKMKDLQSNLNKMHEDIDRNIQNQMQNLDKNLSNMQERLSHMFERSN